MMHGTETQEARGVDVQALAAAFTRGLHVHLEALHVILGDLERQFRDAPHARAIAAAVEEVDRIDRDVELLYEFSVPTPLQPLRCCAEEIARGSQRFLAASQRDRVWLAVEEEASPLNVDGPLLSRTLTYFLENAFDRGSEEVLFHLHQHEGRTYFAILDDLSRDEASLLAEAWDFETDIPDDSLEVALARRDVERMGGTVQVYAAGRGEHCVVVEIPTDAGDCASTESFGDIGGLS